ncbi:MAG: hypothetical protein H6797_03660 [Candidatus Nomurabacteria bacterium]|nr:MAG: hypothetical protein H6797_03660 [Candidatus Nomurabacteria bacterium]
MRFVLPAISKLWITTIIVESKLREKSCSNLNIVLQISLPKLPIGSFAGTGEGLLASVTDAERNGA